MKRNLTTAKNITNNNSKTGTEQQKDKPLLSLLVKWTVWGILAFNLINVVLYILGSYRKTPDEVQLTLVRICLMLSVLMIISSLYGIILDLYYMFTRRRPAYLGGIAGYFITIVLGALLVFGTAFIISAVGGNLH